MGTMNVLAALFLALGTLIACLNLYLHFLRYPLHTLRGGTRENYRNISGFGVISSFFFWLAYHLFAPHPALRWTALTLSVLDPLGAPACALLIMHQLVFSAKRKPGDRPLPPLR